ncbi:MAG: sodium:solute symporter family protein [Acidobacteriota bacterium]
MSAGTIALLCCGLYLLVSLVAGILPGLRVSKSVSGYVAGDRSMNLLVLYFVLGASIFSSFAFLGAPGWAYSRGAAAFYILGYGAVGMVPLYFFGPRTRRLGQRFGFVTQAELLSFRFESRTLSVLLAVLSFIAFIPYLTLQMKGAGFLLATLSDGAISEAVGAAVTYAVVLIYVLSSGVLGVGWTNTLQGVFMMVVAWGLGLYLPHRLHGGVGEMFDSIAATVREGAPALLEAPGLAADGTPWSWWAFSSAVVVSAFGFTAWPHLFMKSYAAASDRVLRWTVVLYPTFQLFLVPILLIGFAGVLAYPGVSPADRILPVMLTEVELSPILVGLVCAGALAASMSSGDAILHAAASIAVRDGLAQVAPSWVGDDASQRQWIRGGVVVVAAIAYYFAVVSEVSIVALLLGAYGGIAQIFPLLFCTFYWPRATGKGALAGLGGGLAVNTFFLVLPQLKPWPLHEGVYGLAANVLLLVVVSLMTRPGDPERLRACTEA